MGWETEKPIWDRVFSQLAVRARRVSYAQSIGQGAHS